MYFIICYFPTSSWISDGDDGDDLAYLLSAVQIGNSIILKFLDLSLYPLLWLCPWLPWCLWTPEECLRIAKTERLPRVAPAVAGSSSYCACLGVTAWGKGVHILNDNLVFFWSIILKPKPRRNVCTVCHTFSLEELSYT